MHVLLNSATDGSNSTTRVFRACTAAIPDRRIDPALPLQRGALQPMTLLEWTSAIEDHGLTRHQQAKRCLQLPRSRDECAYSAQRHSMEEWLLISQTQSNMPKPAYPWPRQFRRFRACLLAANWNRPPWASSKTRIEGRVEQHLEIDAFVQECESCQVPVIMLQEWGDERLEMRSKPQLRGYWVVCLQARSFKIHTYPCSSTRSYGTPRPLGCLPLKGAERILPQAVKAYGPSLRNTRIQKWGFSSSSIAMYATSSAGRERQPRTRGMHCWWQWELGQGTRRASLSHHM